MTGKKLWLLVGPAALAFGAADIVLTLKSNHEHQPVLWAVLGSLVGWAFIASGLIGWTRRPDNGTGRLLVGVGLAFFVSALWQANDSVVFTLGNVFGVVFFAVFLHLLLTYPHGRTRTSLERGFVLAVYPIAVLSSLLPSLFDAERICSDCPKNAFVVVDSQAASSVLEAAFSVLGVAIFLGVFAVLARRWRAATAAARRQLIPVYMAGGTAVVFIGIAFAIGFASGTAANVVWSIALVGFVAVPFFFLGGLLRSRLARVAAARMLLETPDEPTLEEAQASLRRALGDPTVQLLEWEPEEACYVDTHGNRVQEPSETARRAVTPIEYEGRPLAALVHDVALHEEPDLLAEVVATVRLALEKDRKERVLQRSEARNRALLDVLPDLMIRFRRDGTYLDIEGDTSGLVRPAEELIGRSVWDALPAETVEPLMRCAERALARGAMESIEYELEIGGKRRLFEVRMIPSGEDEIVSVVRDFTERRRLEAELEMRLEELHRSRARIVEAGDAERRRLERNLHDGAQQRLVSISLALRLAQARLEADPQAAGDILAKASDELALALEELRELARGIHPAVLTDRGLAAALESLAERAPVAVELCALPAERLPAPVEAAAFYVVSESLTNVAKYAQASYARVSVMRADGRAIVEVADDGVGGADPSRGSGLRGLADRVEALDGQLEVSSSPGAGTQIRAEIPLRLA